jgi:hypothetical protein
MRKVSDESTYCVEARGLEARYRAKVEEVAGASIAYERMRLSAARIPTEAHAPWLVEAAAFERAQNNERRACAHLEALRSIAPAHPIFQREDAASPVLSGLNILSAANFAPVSQEPISVEIQSSERTAAGAPTLGAPFEGELDHMNQPLAAGVQRAEQPNVEDDAFEDESRVETLRRKFEADPTDDAVVDEMAVLLAKLDRGLELLSLLSARLEDAPETRRAALIPKQIEVLTRLEQGAREAGRSTEADLYQMSREQLEEETGR